MKHLLIGLCLLWIAAPASAFFGPKKTSEYEYENEKPWVEIQGKMPDYPKPENLLEFDAGPASNNLHFVDSSSISVGEDGVVRYSLVVKSPTGAMNVSYEGIRCQTNEARFTPMAARIMRRGRQRKWENGSIWKISSRIMRNGRSSDIFSVLSGLK